MMAVEHDYDRGRERELPEPPATPEEARAWFRYMKRRVELIRQARLEREGTSTGSGTQRVSR